MLARRIPLALGLAGLMVVVLLAVGGWWFASREISNRLTAQAVELRAVTELKALQLSEWHRERIDDALGRAVDPFLVASVRAWLGGQQSPQLAEQLQTAIAPRREPWRYLNVWLLDLDGNRIFDARRQRVDANLEPGLLAECRRARQPVFGVLRNLESERPFLDICMPVVELGAKDATPAAIEIYRADASQLLLPTVRFFSPPGSPRRTTIVRFAGAQPQVVVSSAASVRPGDLPSMVPAGFLAAPNDTRSELDVVGRDGIRRVVVTRRAANTPWVVIVGVERSEALGGAYEEIAIVALLAGALGIAGYLSFLLVLQRRERDAARQTLRLDRLLQVRSAINEAIVRIRDPKVMLSRFCELAVSLGRFQLAAVYRWQRDTPKAGLVAWHGHLPERLADADNISVDAAVKEGPVRTLFEDGRVAIVPDLRTEPRTAWTEALLAAGHRAIVAMPIRDHNRLVGSFWLYSSEAGTFDRRDVQLFNELAADISYALESVAADERRRETELQLNAAFEAAPFAMFLIGRDDGTVIRANVAAIRQYGYEESELIGHAAATIFSSDELAPATSPDAEGGALPVTAMHRRKDGTALTVELSVRAVAVAGRPCEMVVAVDVTARRELEEQFRQAQRLEGVGKLAGGVAHDFNNLLTVIAGFAAMLLEDLPDDAAARTAAEQIRIAAGRATELTKSLLAFSRRQVLHAKYVHLNDMIRETATMLSRLISEEIVLHLRLDASRDAVNVDPSQMQQVLINLAVNARDAMPRGGRLTISTGDLDGHLELRVSDTGTGIAPDVLEHIFEPFYTTKQPGAGTGLGLPTVHGIVTQSGGVISVDTETGRGTTFIITLPRAQPLSAPEPQQPPVPVPSRTGMGTVMLVEDDEGVRSLATLALQRGGYTVIAFANGAAALARAASGALGVDVVLTDVVMPGMSGPELMRRLRTYYPTMPVIYMSGYAEEATARLEIDPRTLDLLHKPFAPQDLLKRVEAALGRAPR
jgi:two-component system cell cycle sensor histidine kinase/response regulator CckA